jgi:ribosomal-protein-alanine N-acetyltransferase
VERIPATLRIRPAEPRDVEPILAIQSLCPEIAQWTVRDYDRVARGEMARWVAEDESGVTGFIVARQVLTDLEILNLAVRPDARGREIATQLLRQTLKWSESFEARRAILEVRASNLAALRFYERNKFQVVGRRPRYYTGPVEDALLLTRTLD